MLTRVGLLTAEEGALVLAALDRTEHEITEGTFEFAPTDEDIHTAIERRVTELAGDAGAKLHTGRSRNDQVATALRLFVRREGLDVARGARACRPSSSTARSPRVTPRCPGTRISSAPSRCCSRTTSSRTSGPSRATSIVGATRSARVDVSPLGAGALAGSSLPLDPDHTAATLGFAARFDNSLDAVSDRDFVAEALFVATLGQVHLSRLGEEIVLWSTEEFGFLHLADAYSTGSSMLPQKKNPDIAELARGKAGRLIGELTGLLATLKGLPLAYNRDLQEDKEPLFDALDQHRLALRAVAGPARDRRVRRGAHAGGGRHRDVVGDRPRRVAGARRACRSVRRTRASAPWCAARRNAASASRSSCSPIPTSGPTRSRCSSRVRRCCAARRRAAPAPHRSRCSSTPRVPGSPSRRAGSIEPHAATFVLRAGRARPRAGAAQQAARVARSHRARCSRRASSRSRRTGVRKTRAVTRTAA